MPEHYIITFLTLVDVCTSSGKTILIFVMYDDLSVLYTGISTEYTGCFTDSGFFEMLISPSIFELSL